MQAATSILPTLLPSDVQRAAQLIQQAYSPYQALGPEDQRRLQQELFEIQRRPEAWGLVVPFLEHEDPNVQFFGAHTAQVKIARDWEQFPQEHVAGLKDIVLELAAGSVVAGRNKTISRKLFVALTSLALKLCSTRPPQWKDWVLESVQYMTGRGASTEHALDFLEIVAQEVESADLLSPARMQIQQTLLDAVPLVMEAIRAALTRSRPHPLPSELRSALKCFEAWVPQLPANDLTPLIPILISLLVPLPSSSSPSGFEFEDASFEPVSNALQEIMTKSALSDGSGSRTLTEPLLVWCDRWGGRIVEETVNSGVVDEISHSFCQLLVALGDHSTAFFASHLASGSLPSATASAPSLPINAPNPFPPALPTKSALVQTFLRLLMAYTGLPGYYGIDEEESEMTLGFWYLYQEALWSVDYQWGFNLSDDLGEDQDESDLVREQEREKGERERERDSWVLAKAVYRELVKVLRRKCVWPSPGGKGGERWSKDQADKFQVYRRDVGDTLINAYYVLRDEMLEYFVNYVLQYLAARQEHQGWEDVEATLHCIMSIQEGLPVEDNIWLRRIFGAEVLGRLPSTGRIRVRRTALVMIGTYASWFTTQPAALEGQQPTLLMNAISYVVAALPEPALCLQAANALRDLCDANRTALAPHISAFGELHASLTGIPDTEKGKVLQSIASVIQALPPEEEIPPVEAIVTPVVAKLHESLRSFAQLPEEAQVLAIQQLQTLTCVAKGLTRATDVSLVLDDEPDDQAEIEKLQRAREDPRIVKLREAILTGIRGTMELMSTDAAVSDAISDLFKSITALPSDSTLLSLPPGPLLELVCLAAQRQLTAVWLSLASMLVIQLDPPPIFPTSLKSVPSPESWAIVTSALPVLLQISLSALSQPGAMEANPDIVQAFFGCMEAVSQHFVGAFYRMPPGAFEALMQCTTTSLALQERYSLVAACTFLNALINRTTRSDDLGDAKTLLIEQYGKSIVRAILCGFAGVAPRTATPNLIELLATLLSRFPAESRAWVAEIISSNDLPPSKANHEALEKFVKAVTTSRSMKRTRDAAQEFVLVARGLEGSSFGYSSVVDM